MKERGGQESAAHDMLSGCNDSGVSWIFLAGSTAGPLGPPENFWRSKWAESWMCEATLACLLDQHD